VQQGRVALDESSAKQGGVGSSLGFGMHLVNCSTNTLGGGMSTAEVEAEFTAKFGDMAKYDAFMDYNAALLSKFFLRLTNLSCWDCTAARPKFGTCIGILFICSLHSDRSRRLLVGL
jgi:hypothetical protein